MYSQLKLKESGVRQMPKAQGTQQMLACCAYRGCQAVASELLWNSILFHPKDPAELKG